MGGSARFDFTGASVLITGGGTGIGEGIADAFADAGAHVTVGGRRLEPLQRFCNRHPGRSGFVQMDVSKDEDRRRAVDAVIERCGRLDVLVNNAMNFTPDPFETVSAESMSSMFGVLLMGSTTLTQLCLPHLEKTKGCIINISSVVGRFVPYPPNGFVTYSAAKAGINQFSRALAGEIGPKGVRINVIAPGPTMTEAIHDLSDPEVAKAFDLTFGASATPLGRVGQPADIAAVALYLASDAAGWVTGQVIDASGGWGLTG